MKRATALALTTMLAATVAPTIGQADATCAATEAPRWGRYGADEHSTRYQTDSDITAANAETLTRAWSVTSAVIGGGSFMSTPVVVDGCVFVATDSGRVAVFQQDNGQIVWQRNVAEGEATNGYAGYVVGAPAVDDERVYVPLSVAGAPRLLALSREDGSTIWDTPVSPPGDTQANEYLNAGPVIAGDVIFQGVSGAESRPDARGGYAIIDRETGEPLAREYTIDDDDYAFGYRGASIWSTGAYDAQSGYVFVGGGNPASKDKEHPNSNAVLKIDVKPGRSSFGTIVDAYKGNTDQYYPGLDRQPACDARPDITYLSNWSLTCLQLDLDFGASPNLWYDDAGHLMVGILQKAGVFHVMYAETMSAAWTAPVGVPCVACNLSSSAVDDGKVYVIGSPGTTFALAKKDSRLGWANASADGLHHQGVTVVNDLVVTSTMTGLLMGWDAATGVNALTRSTRLETGQSGSGSASGGVAAAGSDLVWTVGTGSGSQLIVHRLPAA